MKYKFLQFDKPTFDAEKNEISIKNIKEEKERLTKYFDERFSLISETEDAEEQAKKTNELSSDLSRFKKEISAVKKEVRDSYTKNLLKELDEFYKEYELEIKEVEKEVDEKLVAEGKATIFYKAPTYVIETGEINNPEKVQLIITFLERLDVPCKVKSDGKTINFAEVLEPKKEKEKQAEEEDDESFYSA